jgi:hypothetical protein
MRRCAAKLLALLLLSAVAAGCGRHTRSTSCKPKTPPAELPLTGRSAIEPDLSALRAPRGSLTRPPAEYRRLTAEDTRILAVTHTPLADDLDRMDEPRKHPHKHDPTDTTRRVRGYLADELRNRNAAETLNEYFQLLQSEGQADLLAKSFAEVRARLTDAEEAQKQGLADRAGIDNLRIQLLELESKGANLDAGIDSLNVALRARLGLDTADALRLWPNDPLRVSPDDIDIEEAVRTGLYYRPDLNLIRTLLADGGQGADDLGQAVLMQVSPLLARLKNNPLVELLTICREREKRDKTRSQLESLLESRTRQAEAEIRAAALTLRGHRLATAAKAAEVARQAAVLAELEKRAAAGQSVASDLSRSRLELWRLQGEVLQSAINWHTAHVKLRQAMGLLVRQ